MANRSALQILENGNKATNEVYEGKSRLEMRQENEWERAKERYYAVHGRPNNTGITLQTLLKFSRKDTDLARRLGCSHSRRQRR